MQNCWTTLYGPYIFCNFSSILFWICIKVIHGDFVKHKTNQSSKKIVVFNNYFLVNSENPLNFANIYNKFSKFLNFLVFSKIFWNFLVFSYAFLTAIENLR